MMVKSKKQQSRVGAVILGAGLASRMGSPKLLLPWGKEFVIEKIINTLKSSEVDPIVLVTGASHDLLSSHLEKQPVEMVINPDYADGNMVHSLQVGLRKLQSLGVDSALLALGDQPQIEAEVVHQVLEAARKYPSHLILPSFQMKRGHPWVIPTNPLVEYFQPD